MVTWMSLPDTPPVGACHLEPSGPVPVKPQRFREILRLNVNKARRHILLFIFFTLIYLSDTKRTHFSVLWRNEAGIWQQHGREDGGNLWILYQHVINSSRTQCLSYRSKYVLSLEREKGARHSLHLLFWHQQQLRWYNYNHMFIYSVRPSRDHPVKKNSDDKLSSLEGFYSSAVFKCKCRKCWSNQTKCRMTNKIIWGRIRDPRIHELCDFGLHKHNSQ